MTWGGRGLEKKGRYPNCIIFGKITNFCILKPNIFACFKIQIDGLYLLHIDKFNETAIIIIYCIFNQKPDKSVGFLVRGETCFFSIFIPQYPFPTLKILAKRVIS